MHCVDAVYCYMWSHVPWSVGVWARRWVPRLPRDIATPRYGLLTTISVTTCWFYIVLQSSPLPPVEPLLCAPRGRSSDNVRWFMSSFHVYSALHRCKKRFFTFFFNFGHVFTFLNVFFIWTFLQIWCVAMTHAVHATEVKTSRHNVTCYSCSEYLLTHSVSILVISSSRRRRKWRKKSVALAW